MASVLKVPETDIEITAYVVGDSDLCIVLNAVRGSCIARILLKDMCALENSSNVIVTDYHVIREEQVA